MSVQFEKESVSFENVPFRTLRKSSLAEKLVSWGFASTLRQAQIVILILALCAIGFSVISLYSLLKDSSPSISAPKNNSLINEPNIPPRLSKPVY